MDLFSGDQKLSILSTQDCKKLKNNNIIIESYKFIFIASHILLYIFIIKNKKMCQCVCCNCYWINCCGVCAGWHDAFVCISFWLCKPE